MNSAMLHHGLGNSLTKESNLKDSEHTVITIKRKILFLKSKYWMCTGAMADYFKECEKKRPFCTSVLKQQ